MLSYNVEDLFLLVLIEKNACSFHVKSFSIKTSFFAIKSKIIKKNKQMNLTDQFMIKYNRLDKNLSYDVN